MDCKLNSLEAIWPKAIHEHWASFPYLQEKKRKKKIQQQKSLERFRSETCSGWTHLPARTVMLFKTCITKALSEDFHYWKKIRVVCSETWKVVSTTVSKTRQSEGRGARQGIIVYISLLSMFINQPRPVNNKFVDNLMASNTTLKQITCS